MPVIDLRLKLGLSRTEATIDTCVIIIEVETAEERLILGALADSVQEVIELDPRFIQPPPRMGTRVNIGFIRGIAKRDEQFIMLLDINRVLTDEELRAVGVAQENEESSPATVPPRSPEASTAEAR